MSARVYFYRNGQELSDHPANGLRLVGIGANHARWARKSNRAKGDFARRGPLGATDAIELMVGRTTYALRPDAFDGPVMVKFWWSPECVEWRAFCTLEDAVAAGAEPTGHDNEHWSYDGRGVDYQGWAPFDEYLATRK